MPLAFLSPRIVSAIADGEALGRLTVSGLARSLPHKWIDQECWGWPRATESRALLDLPPMPPQASSPDRTCRPETRRGAPQLTDRIASQAGARMTSRTSLVAIRTGLGAAAPEIPEIGNWRSEIWARNRHPKPPIPVSAGLQDAAPATKPRKLGHNLRRRRAVSNSENIGWGGRIRTSVWRNQNPLPYRLATPQHSF